MNFKRRATKRRVRCTHCTKHRWLGNNKGRRPAKETSAKEEIENG